MSTVRVRIAPSPTGYLHIGTARSALFNYLFSHKNGGTFVVRVEDTDKQRSTKEFEEDILSGLRWLGIAWDEGPEVGGPYEPYYQSQRLGLYRSALEKLIGQGDVYPCYCTTEELDAERATAEQLSQPFRYSGKCRDLPIADRQALEEQGKQHVYRFRMPSVDSANPASTRVIVQDLIRGDVEFDVALLDDVVLAKSVDEPLYNFAVVVDDEAMKITHVIRGEDHISNTPKQILLAKALGYTPPQFAHIPLILNTDRTKMSKRKNVVRLEEYRSQGYLPEAIVNFLALLGWNPGTEQEVMDLETLTREFSLERVQKSGAIFNTEKLLWMNGQYIKKCSREDYLRRAKEFLSKFYPDFLGSFLSGVDIDSTLVIHKDRISLWSELVMLSECFTRPSLGYARELLIWPKSDIEAQGGYAGIAAQLQELSSLLHPLTNWDAKALEQAIKEWIGLKGYKVGDILWPMRIALSGQAQSAGPFELAACYGHDRTMERLGQAIELLTKL